jgi:hypothetical protein
MRRDESFGLLAEFVESDDLLQAAARVYEAGYRRFECYSPLPVEGLADAIGFRRTRMPQVVLIGGIIGGLAGLALQYYTMVIAYPLNIGGRPLFSWPMFVPVVFEMTVLVAALSAVLGMLAMNGLPRPHHPLFAIPSFDRATQDRFFVCILSTDPKYDLVATREFLQGLGPVEVLDVPMP